MIRAFLVVCALLASASLALAQEAAPKPVPSVTLPPELARVLTDYETAWRRGDAAALARLFDEDGFVLSNGAPPVRGRAAIQARYEGSGGPLFFAPSPTRPRAGSATSSGASRARKGSRTTGSTR